MKRLSIILGVLLLVAGCGQGKKVGSAASVGGPSARESELDSLSKISIIKDTTVWPGFNRVNRKGQRVGMWKETGTFYYEYEYDEEGNEIVYKMYSRLTGTLMRLDCIKKERNLCAFCYHFDYTRPLDVICLDLQPGEKRCKVVERNPNSKTCKYRCMKLTLFKNGAVSSVAEVEYDEDPLWYEESLWERYFKVDGTESDVEPGEPEKRTCTQGLNNLDSLGRRQGLWLEDDGYREVYYKDGVVDGVFRSYSRETGTLLSIGWYSKGILSGRWFYFDDYGKLLKIKDYPDLEGSPAWLVRHLTPDRNDAHNEQRPDRTIGS